MSVQYFVDGDHDGHTFLLALRDRCPLFQGEELWECVLTSSRRTGWNLDGTGRFHQFGRGTAVD